MRKRLLAAVALVAATAGVKAADLLPPFTVGYEPTNVDERGLWMDSDNRERQIRDSKLTVHDEELNRYLTGVLCRTVGAERCRGVRIYVMQVPAFNASMSPNGMMEVWTGLLLRVQSEAELATILGHEFAHFELRHSLDGFKQQRRSTNAGAWLAVLGGLSNTNTSGLQLSVIASSFKYNRDQEQAADLLGFRYLAAAGYPTSAAPDVWRHVMAEQDATAVGHGRRPKPEYQDGFFNTHPASARRAIYLEAESKKIGDTGKDDGAARLRAAIAPHLPEWLDAQVKLNDFGGTEYILEQLAGNGWSGDLLYARGELYRLRGNPRDLATSIDFYKGAIAAGYRQPQVQRNLGMALLRSGRPADGKSALGEYLRLLPGANDAKAIQALMAN